MKSNPRRKRVMPPYRSFAFAAALGLLMAGCSSTEFMDPNGSLLSENRSVAITPASANPSARSGLQTGVVVPPGGSLQETVQFPPGGEAKTAAAGNDANFRKAAADGRSFWQDERG